MVAVYLTTYATDTSTARLACLNFPDIINLASPNKTWSGYKDKIVGMKRFLEQCAPTDIVCFTDAYDAICALPILEEIRSRFVATNTDVLFSAETSCYPWPHVSYLYKYTPSPYRFLNSGGYIGYVWALQIVLGHDMKDSPCDQSYFTYVYLNHINAPREHKQPYRFKLDHECTLFQTFYGIPWDHFLVDDTGRFHNIRMGTQPCLIHFNGNQGDMTIGGSIMQHIAKAIKERQPLDIKAWAYLKKHEVIKEFASDADIVSLAEETASRYVPPDPSKISQRDRNNHHAIFWGPEFDYGEVKASNFEEQWHTQNRCIVSQYLQRISADIGSIPIDVSLHDFVGLKSNTEEWPHSIMSFSTCKNDDHNVLIPDLYAMQNYKGSIEKARRCTTPTLQRMNKLLFIGSSTGTTSIETNRRIQLCLHARKPGNGEWIEAYISGVSNFSPQAALQFQHLMHNEMTHEEQCAFRHLIVCDGNTACWDRLPWILASKSVCWKEDSDHQCWYYPFLKPWVHYVPFNLQNIRETWDRVKDDTNLQLRIVEAANKFVDDFLMPERHALYTRTLLDTIGKRLQYQSCSNVHISQSLLPLSYMQDLSHSTDIVWYCGDDSTPWSPFDTDLGGSEQAVVFLSREWAASGKRVAVFGALKSPRYDDANGAVTYYCTKHHYFDPHAKYHTLIMWRYPGLKLLEKPQLLQAKRVWVDLHDNEHQGLRLVVLNEDRIDKIFFKSQFHHQEYVRFRNQHNTKADDTGMPEFCVIPNGVRMDLFAPFGNAVHNHNPYMFIYCSCYARGLTEILKHIWPHIYGAEPRAELHLYYGIGDSCREHPVFKEVRSIIGDALGVMNHGRRPASEVALAKMKAGFHLYPTMATSEIDCISVRESAAAGCIPFLLDHGVFKERDGIKLRGDPANEADGKRMAKQIVQWMRAAARNDASVNQLRTQLMKSPTLTDWTTTANQWLSFVAEDP